MKALSFLIAVFASTCSIAQQQAPSLETMLNDANYVLNRYEELASGRPCDRVKPQTLQQECRDVIAASAGNIRAGKIALGQASRARVPNLLDIFDVYVEIQEAAGNLNFFSSLVNQFSDADAIPYAETGAKADVLAASLGLYIRGRIASCKETNSSK